MCDQTEHLANEDGVEYQFSSFLINLSFTAIICPDKYLGYKDMVGSNSLSVYIQNSRPYLIVH